MDLPPGYVRQFSSKLFFCVRSIFGHRSDLFIDRRRVRLFDAFPVVNEVKPCRLQKTQCAYHHQAAALSSYTRTTDLSRLTAKVHHYKFRMKPRSTSKTFWCSKTVRISNASFSVVSGSRDLRLGDKNPCELSHSGS